MPEPAHIRLRLLGRFVAEFDGDPPRVVEIPGRLRRALLAYLAMQPGYADTRERVAALLWGDTTDRLARQNLRQTLLDLKREFEAAEFDPLRIDRETLALNPDVTTVDAREFLTLSQSNDLVDLERAINLYGGPFLDGLDLEATTFGEWLGQQRSRIETAAALVLEKYATRQDELRNGALAIRTAERLVALDPLRESAQRLLIRLLARHSGRDAALARANNFIETLRAELDAAPEKETIALIEEIRNSPAAPAAPVTVRRPAVEADHVPSPTSDTAAPPSSLARSTLLTVSAAGAAVVGLVALLIWVTRPADVPLPPNNPRATAPTSQQTADESWRSPGIAPGAGAGNIELALSGLYPIVVLPFVTETADHREEKAIAERITDDLISDLSRVPAMRVIARATSQLYAGRIVDVAAVGRELDVRYVIEGRVRLRDEKTRIDVALIDPKTRLQVWSERFERDNAERHTTQDDIVRSIVRHLHLNVFESEMARRGPPRAGDPAIDELLAKGWNGIFRIFELGTTSGADGYFDEVLRRQPNNGSAMLGLAGYRIATVAMFAVPDREPHLTQGGELLERVIKANPRASLAHYYLGMLHKMRGENEQAMAAFRKVLDINPSFPLAYANLGHVLSRSGRIDDGLEHVRYAIRLSPKDPSLGSWSLYAGEIELERHRDDAALEWLKRAVELHPRAVFNRAALAAYYALHGNRAAAAQEAAKTREIAPWLTLEVMIERLTSTSAKGHEPKRLIEGLTKAFGPTG